MACTSRYKNETYFKVYLVCMAAKERSGHSSGFGPPKKGTVYSTVQLSTVQYTVQHSTVQYNAVQYSAAQYSTVQYNTGRLISNSTVQYNTGRLIRASPIRNSA